MKKFLLFILVVIIASVVAVYSYLDIMIKRGIETYAPQALGVGVSVGSVSVALESGYFSISNFKVHNPEGFTQPNIFEMDSIKVRVDFKSIFQPVVHIYDVTITKPVVVYELGEDGDNVKAFKNRVGNSSVGVVEGSAKPTKKIQIDSFNIKGTKMTASLSNLANKSIDLEDIHISGIGADGGATPDQVADIVTREIANEIAKANIKLILENFGDDIKKSVKDIQDKSTEILNDTMNKVFNKK